MTIIPGTRRLYRAATRLRRQDAEANIGEADGPKGEPQEAASQSIFTS